MDEREILIALYDIYSVLLTQKQKEYFENYYFNDFSLAEIADNYQVSRNAVFDLIKKAAKNLMEYEEKLHCREKMIKLSKLPLDEKTLEEIQTILEE